MIHNMNSPVDYRRLAQHTRGLYFLTPDRTSLLHKAFLECGEDSLAAAGAAGAGAAAAGTGAVGNPGPAHVEVAMGRSLHVPQALGGFLLSVLQRGVAHGMLVANNNVCGGGDFCV